MDDPTHAFDFWLGEWEVHDPEGRHVGRNSITAPFDTGALAEHWRGDGGVVGHSLTAWDAERGCWHQTWMDSTGGVLLLDGDVRNGAVVLEGVGVRQLWETSKDDGETWQTAFDGRYSRG